VAVPTGYPPEHHILRDLNLETETLSESTAHARLRASPYIADDSGGVRIGVLAILVDAVGGSLAARAVLPDWMATADLTIQSVAPALGPIVEARASVLRKGKTTLVVEAAVFCVDEAGGSPAEGSDGPVAWATMTFAILPGQSSRSTINFPSDAPSRWVIDGGEFDRPVVDALHLSVLKADEGQLSMPVVEYLFNSFQAVQGGVMALVAEVAGGMALSARQGPSVVSDLQVAYLALGRTGPIVTRTRVLDSDDVSLGGGAVVELVDEGANGRLTTVVNMRAVPKHSPVPTAGRAGRSQ
jgi:acyl-coenzyme A thioesterase PaaI-like protein